MSDSFHMHRRSSPSKCISILQLQEIASCIRGRSLFFSLSKGEAQDGGKLIVLRLTQIASILDHRLHVGVREVAQRGVQERSDCTSLSAGLRFSYRREACSGGTIT